MSRKKDATDRLIDRVLKYYRLLPVYQQQKKGRFSILKKDITPQTPIRITSMRQQLYEGLKATNLRLNIPITVWNLHDDEFGTWMSTQFQELAQMDEVARKAKGKFLIGGLGLGVIAQLLTYQSKVESITVIERENDLIDLIGTFIDYRINIINEDLFEYLKFIKSGQYDGAFFDIWQRTGEWTWQTQVVPLRRLAHNKIKKIWCWQEKEMTGQMREMLFRVADMNAEKMWKLGASTQHYWVFRKGIQNEFKTERITKNMDIVEVYKIMEENSQNELLCAFVNLFLNKVATPAWEKRFGKYWDESQALFNRIAEV